MDAGPAMCLEICVTNKAQTLCHPSLPALTSSCQSRSPIPGQNAWLCYLHMHPNFKGEARHERLSRQAWAMDRGSILSAAESIYCQTAQTLTAHHSFSLTPNLSIMAVIPHSVARSWSDFPKLAWEFPSCLHCLSVFSLHCYLPLLPIQFFSLMYRTFP